MVPEDSIPVIDIEELLLGTPDKDQVARAIGAACRDYGFFYIRGHGVSESLHERLEEQSQAFFALPLDAKMRIEMRLGGRAWRGYFPPGNELTSGKPDMKEGLYFGEELGKEHPFVQEGLPLHGRNLLPDEELPEFRHVVLEYLEAMIGLGHKLLEGIALSLDLEGTYFQDRYTKDPLPLFRIFNYPKQESEIVDGSFGVGEHTDYGVLTILKQDALGGLEVKCKSTWIPAPPIPGTFVCNIGDMLDRMTGGLYRSTPHRVKCPTSADRLSFPFFFDPNFKAEVQAIEGLDVHKLKGDDYEERWDKVSVHQFTGTYGDYLLKKVTKVFPYLQREVF
jgi:isopenicillin N synthase-like dioxygenase